MNLKQKIIKIIALFTVIVFSIVGCSKNNTLGKLDTVKSVYENDYFNFLVTEKLDYSFIEIKNNAAQLDSLHLTELFKLEDYDTKDVVLGYYTEIYGSLDKTVEIFTSAIEDNGCIKLSGTTKVGEYLVADFKNNSKSFRVSFIERENCCLIFVMTYNNDGDKVVRAKYTNYISFR